MHGMSGLGCCDFYGPAVPLGASGDEQHSWPLVWRGTASGRECVVSLLLAAAAARVPSRCSHRPVPQRRSGAAIARLRPGFCGRGDATGGGRT
jgi:hypothetical protein